MQTRQKFLDSLQIKIDEQPSTEIKIKEETFKPIELIPQINEPFLDEPPPSSKRKISLPPLDIKTFIK
jgi:hypothetical protein